MNASISPGVRIFGGVLLIAALLGISVWTLPINESSSQSTSDDPPTLIEHLRTELQAKDPGRRTRALMDIVALGQCSGSCTISLYSIQGTSLRIENETGTRSVVDLTSLLPVLMKTYQRGPDDSHRLMALSALIEIGDEKTLEQLVDAEAPRQSERVTRLTQMGLASFYLQKYPELAENAQRSGKLFLDDVARAKAVRVRAEKRAGKEAG